MSSHTIAIHEASHAVVGICVGWAGFLEKVNIIADVQRRGGCFWVNPKLRIKNADEDAAVKFAGPLGQVLLDPDSLGEDLPLFQKTIYQPPAVAIRAGVGGWYLDNYKRRLKLAKDSAQAVYRVMSGANSWRVAASACMLQSA